MTVTAAFNQGSKSSELIIHYEDVVHNLFGDTSGGKSFLLVADARPEGNGKSQIEVYRAAGAAIGEAIKAWTNGDVRGCPDPTRTTER